MALIENLADTFMLATSLTANQPSDDRVVIVHDYDNEGNQVAGTCRFVNGKWFDVYMDGELTDGFTDAAIWSECYLNRK